MIRLVKIYLNCLTMLFLERLWGISENGTSRKVALKRIAKPKVFREDLVGVHMAKPVLVTNRPIKVGFAILDLSKYLRYDFHYNTWMKKFPNSTLLFTDTDSLAYEVVGHDLYAEIKDEFDFSEYPKNHF